MPKLLGKTVNTLAIVVIEVPGNNNRSADPQGLQ
jgi:hypothetical protein